MHSWSTFGAKTIHGQLGHIRLTTARTWGKPPPSPLQYIMRFSTKTTSKCLFVPGLPSGSPKFPTTRIPTTLEVDNFACRPLIAMRSKAKLQSQSRAFNNMLHVAYTQRNWVYSRLLVIENQTTNLTRGLSLGHNLCFKCPNGRCEPILNIYVSINFQ